MSCMCCFVVEIGSSIDEFSEEDNMVCFKNFAVYTPYGDNTHDLNITCLAEDGSGITSRVEVTVIVLATPSPTSFPSSLPTKLPTEVPSSEPTSFPSSDPTKLPTVVPSSQPTALPTADKTVRVYAGDREVLDVNCPSGSTGQLWGVDSEKFLVRFFWNAFFLLVLSC